jgi:hypothetical protein
VDAALSKTRVVVLPAAEGAYVLTGSNVGLYHGWAMTAGSGSYALTGTPVTFHHPVIFRLNAGSYALTGYAATLTSGTLADALFPLVIFRYQETEPVRVPKLNQLATIARRAGLLASAGGGGGSGTPGPPGPPGPPGTPGASSSVFNFKADTHSTTASDPGTGKVRWNTVVQASATELYFDRLTTDGFDITGLLATVTADDEIIIQDADFALNYQIWKKSASAIIVPDWFRLPVEFVEGTTEFSHNQVLAVIVKVVGEPGPPGPAGPPGPEGPPSGGAIIAVDGGEANNVGVPYLALDGGGA